MTRRNHLITKTRLVNSVYSRTLYKFVNDGYRMPGDTWRAVRSVFQVHNETCNLWSHVVGFWIMYYLLIYTVLNYRGPAVDFMLLVVFCVAAMFCMACSVLYHTMAAAEYRVCCVCHALDWMGVAIFTGASNLLFVHVELGTIGSKLVVGLMTCVVAHTNYQSIVRDRYGVNTLLTICLGSTGLVCWLFNGKTSVEGVLRIYGSYGVGVLVKLLDVPDRFVSVWFVHAHVLFHVCTVIGAYYTWETYYDHFQGRVFRDAVHDVSAESAAPPRR